jgi:hypothetical protein
MTPLGVRSVPSVTAERHARVANLGLGFHQVGPFEFLDTTRSGCGTSAAAGDAARRTSS